MVKHKLEKFANHKLLSRVRSPAGNILFERGLNFEPLAYCFQPPYHFIGA